MGTRKGWPPIVYLAFGKGISLYSLNFIFVGCRLFLDLTVKLNFFLVGLGRFFAFILTVKFQPLIACFLCPATKSKSKTIQTENKRKLQIVESY